MAATAAVYHHMRWFRPSVPHQTVVSHGRLWEGLQQQLVSLAIDGLECQVSCCISGNHWWIHRGRGSRGHPQTHDKFLRIVLVTGTVLFSHVSLYVVNISRGLMVVTVHCMVWWWASDDSVVVVTPRPSTVTAAIYMYCGWPRCVWCSVSSDHGLATAILSMHRPSWLFCQEHKVHIMGKPGMSCVHYLSSFTTHLYNHYRTVAGNVVKYVPPDGFFGIHILQNTVFAMAPP